MIFFDVDQGSEEWFTLRKGILTASRTNQILTSKKEEPSTQQDDLIAELIGEKLSLIPPEHVETYTNRSMRWGQHCEEEARRFYCLERNCEVSNGGFCLTDDERFGASPDSLVGTDGCLELKAPQAHTHAKYIMKGGLPLEYKSQCHTHLIVTGRAWCDLLSYCPGLPPLLVRVTPNEYTAKLKKAMDDFWVRYQDQLAKFTKEQQ